MKKRLYRSREDKMLGGVAGGIAEYLDIDPIILRAIFLVFIFAGGVSIFIYILMWIIIPEAPYEFYQENVFAQTVDPYSDDLPNEKNSKKYWFGIILVAAGFLFLIDNIFPIFDFDYVWPLLLVAFGSLMIYRAVHHNHKKVLS